MDVRQGQSLREKTQSGEAENLFFSSFLFPVQVLRPNGSWTCGRLLTTQQSAAEPLLIRSRSQKESGRMADRPHRRAEPSGWGG